MPVPDAQGGGDAGALAGECELRFAVGIVEDFHIGPGDLAAPAGAQDLQDRLLGGEAAGEMFLRGFVGEAVCLLGGGEAAVEKMLRMVRVHAGDARDFNDVDAMSDDGHGHHCHDEDGGRKLRGARERTGIARFCCAGAPAAKLALAAGAGLLQ